MGNDIIFYDRPSDSVVVGGRIKLPNVLLGITYGTILALSALYGIVYYFITPPADYLGGWEVRYAGFAAFGWILLISAAIGVLVGVGAVIRMWVIAIRRSL